MLSIRWTNFIACWAYWELISLHAEHARKCLKVEYLGWIEYDFQKSRVTGPLDPKVSVSAKKVKKNSCLCTFNKCVLEFNFASNSGFFTLSKKAQSLFIVLACTLVCAYNMVVNLLWYLQIILFLFWIRNRSQAQLDRKLSNHNCPKENIF